MEKKVVYTKRAPAAIGPYSQAIEVGNMLYISGQIGLEPNTMEVVSDDVGEQTRQVLKNLNAILDEANYDLKDVVKTTIYLKNMDDFRIVNEIYGQYFNVHKPARATIEVSRLPKDVKVEIEAIAVR